MSLIPMLLIAAMAGGPAEDARFTVRIVSPSPLYVVGSTRIEAVAVDAAGEPFDGIAWMSLSVDGAPPEHDGRPPFFWDIDAGPALRQHRIEVAATARDGARGVVSTLSSAWPWVESVGVELVLVPVVVSETGPDGIPRFVTGLAREEFTILDEGEPVTIASFSSEPLPASIVIALDTSMSMEPHLWSARRGVSEFVEAQPPWMALSLIAFNDQVFLEQDFTHDRRALAGAVAAARPGGTRTALNEALRVGSRHLARRKGPRVLLFFTDGVETAEEEAGRLRTAIEEAQTAEVTVYGIAWGTGVPPGLAEMVSRTGGEFIPAGRGDGLRDAFGRVAQALGSRYVLGFEPPAVEDRCYRRIEVRVSREGARVLSRDGYVPGMGGCRP